MKKILTSMLVLLLGVFPVFAAAEQGAEDETWALLARAYTYAFPLVLTDATKTAATNVEETDLAGHAPVNQLIHSRKLADANTRLVVTPNVDTVYTQAWLDIHNEPILFVAPEADRFFNVQVLDAWTNTPYVIEEAGTYAFTLPGWTGELPEGVTRVDVPTETVWLIARVVLNGESDLPAVQEIQNRMSLLPLSAYLAGGDYEPPKGEYRPENDFVPIKQVLSMDAQHFFDAANRLMTVNPPAAADAEELQALKELNVGPGLSFDASSLPGDAAAHWTDLLKNLKQTLSQVGAAYTVKLGSWQYFDAPIGDFGTAYAYRAMVALGGLGANPVTVAIYPKTGVDENGDTLTGEKTYVLHFDSLPPTLEDGFWSITAYGEDDFLIANPLGRYCVNDRTGCVMNEDGSLDVVLSADEPGETANWLPVGSGDFHLFMRIYQPDGEALKTWQPPVIFVSGNTAA